MNSKIITVAITTAIGLSLLAVRAEDKKLDASKLPPASTKEGVTYDKDIKPIFENSCVKCHHGEKAKAKLHMDTKEGVIAGGKEGPDVIVGKSGDSPLVYAIAHVGDDEDGFMPPLHNKANIAPLTKEEIGLIRAWIDQGAK